MRNDRQAYLALSANETDAQKAKRIMSSTDNFARRLAALNAAGTDKGKVWR